MPLDLESMLRKCSILNFEEALLRIAADESKHADWLSEKINELGGLLPGVVKTYPTERNSWQYLLDDLEEEQQYAAELETEMLSVESDYPDIMELLRRIDEEEREHRARNQRDADEERSPGFMAGVGSRS